MSTVEATTTPVSEYDEAIGAGPAGRAPAPQHATEDAIGEVV